MESCRMPVCRARWTWVGALSLLVGWIFGSSEATGQEPFVIPPGSVWAYRAQPAAPPKSWREPDFDDSAWPRGPAGFGYGDEDDRTRLESMRGRFQTVQIRREFEVAEPERVRRLYLYLSYDDGFVASLNGIEIARGGVDDDGHADDHEATRFERFAIERPQELLRRGTNILALEGFNRSLRSSDFSLDPVLTTRRVENPGIPRTLSRSEALADLAALQERFEDQSSYLRRRGFPYRQAISSLGESFDETVATNTFARDIQKLIAGIGDAHAGVDTEFTEYDPGYLPFMIADSRDGVVALKADRSGFFADGYPFVVELDGRPIQTWIDAAAEYVSQASPQLIRRRALDELRFLARLRRDIGRSPSGAVRIVLQSADGQRRAERREPLSDERPPRGRIPLTRTRVLEGNIGYLRLESMNNSRRKEALLAMDVLRETDGLIIDVRDNGGGRYGILQELYGYFVPEGTPPYVTNIAAYRLSTRFDADHLNYRPTFRRDHESWTQAQREAIDSALQAFRPEWKLPSGQFSEWHFMVLGRTGAKRQFSYEPPVAVLCNARSFSATDGFLSAMADLPQVALIGQPSGGGSGSTQRFSLPNSGLRIKLSSMASFRPNGKLFDGNGINVDLMVAPEPTDFLGRSDAALTQARQWIAEKNASR